MSGSAVFRWYLSRLSWVSDSENSVLKSMPALCKPTLSCWSGSLTGRQDRVVVRGMGSNLHSDGLSDSPTTYLFGSGRGILTQWKVSFLICNMGIKYHRHHHVITRTEWARVRKSLAPWPASCLQVFAPAVPSSQNTLPQIPNILILYCLWGFFCYQIPTSLLKLDPNSQHSLSAFLSLYIFSGTFPNTKYMHGYFVVIVFCLPPITRWWVPGKQTVLPLFFAEVPTGPKKCLPFNRDSRSICWRHEWLLTSP